MTKPLLLLALVSSALACGRGDTLTVDPSTPAPPELVPAAQLEQFAYKKVLLLPLEGDVDRKSIEIEMIKEKGPPYYMGKLEKSLLSHGFEVISPEIVARVEKTLGGKAKGMSAAEKAMVMGQETQADAVLMVQSISVLGTEIFFAVDGMKTKRVERSKVKQHPKSGEWIHAETEECLVRLPSYEVRLEAKMIDAGSGNVLWVGSGGETMIDALQQSWVAKLDKHCGIKEESFIYGDYIGDEASLARTVSALLDRLIEPMKADAFAGKPIVREKPKPKPEPKPEPPKVKTAIVSANKAALRIGPGARDKKIRTVPRKAVVEIIEQMGEWYRVKLQDGTSGWMHDSTIIIKE